MFRICLICTGNRCRSPVAEGCLKRAVGGYPIEVQSVGLLDLGPAPALPEVIEVASRFGLDLSAHRARPMASVDLAGFDLIIGLERAHVVAAVVEAGAPYDKVFTLTEIVRLLRDVHPPHDPDTAQRARAAVAAAHALRQQETAFVPGEDVVDPFGGPRKGFDDMATLVQRLSQDLIGMLIGPTSAPIAENLSPPPSGRTVG